MKKCKACSASVKISDTEIQHILDEIVNSHEFQIVCDETYENRLNQCFNCSCLQYGTTCMQCGCIVQIRAKLINSTCPFPKKSKWV